MNKGERIKVSIIIPTHGSRALKLDKLLRSISEQDYQGKVEVIIWDDNFENSADRSSVLDLFCKYYSEWRNPSRNITLRLFQNLERGFMVKNRHYGFLNSDGEILLFVDDDNVLPANFVRLFVERFNVEAEEIGLISPKMFYSSHREVIWCAGSVLDHKTTKSEYRGKGLRDEGKFEDVIEVDSAPNVFGVRRNALLAVNGFEIPIAITWTEAMLVQSLKLKGFKSIYHPSIVEYHDQALPNQNKKITAHVLGSYKERAFCLTRNRFIYFTRNSHASGVSRVLFFLFWGPSLSFYYVLKSLTVSRLDLSVAHFFGMMSGYWYALSGKIVSYGKLRNLKTSLDYKEYDYKDCSFLRVNDTTDSLP